METLPTQVDWTEIMRYADVPLLMITFVIASVLKSFFIPKSGTPNAIQSIFMTDPDRYLLVVMILGAGIGGVAESLTPGFEVRLWFRKTLVAAGGAVMLFKMGRTFMPAWFASEKAPTQGE